MSLQPEPHIRETPASERARQARRLIDAASELMGEKRYAESWDSAKAAVELELELEPEIWLARLDQRMALLRGLFAALVAAGKLDRAAATIPLVTSIRQRQAKLLPQGQLISEIEYLIRDARVLHRGLRDIEAWPLLQEAAAMRPALAPPDLDRVTIALGGQLTESAIVFHCSSRGAMAMEASETAGALYRELMRRGSGYYASQLHAKLEELPAPLQRVAFDTEVEASGTPDAEPVSGQKARVLIVDDSALMLDLAREALEGAGYSVDVAQVLSQITDEDRLRTYHLILVDVMMPELYGDDVAAILRGELDGVTAAIYLLSSLADEELTVRARHAGVDGFISKRDGIGAMVQRVHEIIAG